MNSSVLTIPKLFATIFNKLPVTLRQTETYSFYFSDGEFSCIKYKTFDGWYRADKKEFWNLLKYQLKNLIRSYKWTL